MALRRLPTPRLRHNVLSLVLLATALLSPTVAAEGGARAEKKAAPARAPKVAPAKVDTKTNREGVETHTFGAVDVEGRLRSPQIMYFLRRVRAEFQTGALGHRSFLLELSDTRRHRALR
ncbi:MAG: hypothetical protein HRU17_11170 [Polyangiaceae bacterium]|nr:hypothetical protein [Polyangiaceae bacterium]